MRRAPPGRRMPTHREKRPPRTAPGHRPRAVRALVILSIPLCAGCVEILGDYRSSGCSEVDCSRWAKRFGDLAEQAAAGVVVLPDDDLVVLTNGAGTIDFGRAQIKTSGVSDVLVTRFDPGGAERWTQVLSGPGADYGNTIALDPKGNVLVAGSFEGSVTFAGEPLVSAGDRDIFVAKLSPDGDLLWARTFGDLQVQAAYGVGADGEGNVLVTGCFAGDLTVGATLVQSPTSNDVFVMKLDEDGEPRWVYATGAASTLECGARIAADASGNVLVAGNFQGTVTFEQTHATLGVDDVFLAKLDPEGLPLWSRRYGAGGDDFVSGLTITPAGYVVLAGAYQSIVDFGGGISLTAIATYDPFVASIQSDGTTAWATGLGGDDIGLLTGVALDPESNILVSGYSGPNFDDVDAEVTSLGSNGEVRWARRWPSPGSQEATAIAVDAAGDTVLAGRFSDELELSGTALKSAGANDVFLAKLGPSSASPE